MKYIIVLAFVVSPALADVYKCNSGNKTTYQDAPCPDGRVMDRIDSQAPSHQEQVQAMEQAARERDLVARMSEARAADDAREAKSRKGTAKSKAAGSAPVSPGSRQPDKYYDRPDRYYGRSDRYDNRAANNAKPLRGR